MNGVIRRCLVRTGPCDQFMRPREEANSESSPHVAVLVLDALLQHEDAPYPKLTAKKVSVHTSPEAISR